MFKKHRIIHVPATETDLLNTLGPFVVDYIRVAVWHHERRSVNVHVYRDSESGDIAFEWDNRRVVFPADRATYQSRLELEREIEQVVRAGYSFAGARQAFREAIGAA